MIQITHIAYKNLDETISSAQTILMKHFIERQTSIGLGRLVAGGEGEGEERGGESQK